MNEDSRASDGTVAATPGGGLRLPGPVAFLVRVVREEDGGLSGTVERLRTGHKERFREVAALGALMSRMLDGPPMASRSDLR